MTATAVYTQMQAYLAGKTGASYAAPYVIEGLIKLDAVDSAIKAFTKDFEKLCGEGKTMLDC